MKAQIIPAFFLAIFLSFAPAVYAAGTTSTNGGGTTLIRTQDGVMYLGTQTTSSTTVSQSSQSLNLTPDGVIIPTGFAQDFGTLLNAILSFVMVIAALLVFLYLIWGAFDWITSGGDKAKTDKARQKIVSAVIGLIVVAASYAVLNLVVRFLGFTDFNDVLNNVRTIDGRGGPGPTSSLSPTPSPTATPSLSPSPSATTI